MNWYCVTYSVNFLVSVLHFCRKLEQERRGTENEAGTKDSVHHYPSEIHEKHEKCFLDLFKKEPLNKIICYCILLISSLSAK